MRISPRAGKAIAVSLFAGMLPLAGCAEAEEFRAVAGDTIQAGVQTVASGLIDGLFAVFEPDSTSNNNSNSSN